MCEGPPAGSGGLWDLEPLAGATGLGDWMFEQFRPRAGAKVAEVGAGIGTFTRRLLDGGAARVLAVEPDSACADELERRFGSDARVTLARETVPDSPALAQLESACDLVVCQNVLEHIDDDGGAVTAMASALRPGGTLVILVPGHPRLYGALDRHYGHVRRYDRASMRRALAGNGLQLEDLYCFNALGILGWWVKNRRATASLDPRSLRVYERLLKLWRPVEDRVALPVGLCLIAKVRRPA